MKLFNRNGLASSSIRYPAIILLFVILSYKLSYSQTKGQGMIKPSEKCYSEELCIKTDRDLYISGEKVWMKIYKLNGLNLTPENVSKVVYVELLDYENNPVSQFKIGIDGFSGSGGFRLPDTLSTGNYIIRSYTNWMQNFSEDLFSYRTISVINPFKINEIKIPSINQLADSVAFFPEGGSLIAAIESLIGFKCMDKDGEPVSISATVVNNGRDSICRIRTGSGGYGWATINPSLHDNLYLVTRDNYGRTRKFRMPAVRDEGILLSVPRKEEKSSVLFRIRKSPNFAPSGDNIFLVMNSAGLTGFRQKIGTGNDGEIAILKKDVPSGLSHVTIVDGHGAILADRWVYNEISEGVKFNISIPKNLYSSREKIEMTITATDSKGNPVESDYSVSVARAVTVSEKGFDNKKIRQLPVQATSDNVRLLPDINDWLIFYNSHDLVSDPGEKFKGSDPLILPEMEGHLISGNIRNRKTGEPVKNENISLSFVGKSALCQFAKTNEKGEFHFKTSERGTREIVIQPLSEKITDYYVELINPFTPATKKYNRAPFVPDSSRLADINNVIISMQINNIYEPYTQAARKNTVIRTKPDFYGKPDNTILLSKYIELTSLKEVVKEIIPGVSTVKKNDKINFKLYYQYQSKPFENNPLVLVDGVPVYDLEKVISINSRDLEKIDVFTTRYYISDIVMDGILHFVTKKGNLDVIDLNRSVYRVEYDLPENPDQFWSPDYSSAEQLAGHIPDFRNTLYWNPDMHTGKSGKSAVEFYSSDESGEYTITVEGITSDGKTGNATLPLVVNSNKK